MPTFDIIKEIKPKKSFRIASVMGKFDLQSNHITERFKGSIDIDNDWQIGLIVGKSGTGKTTISKQLFPESYITNFDYKSESILDDMPKDCSIEEITNTFSSVGFSSPPSWLKPYQVLSNGEKMRVDLANAILQKNDLFVFDEFTSVVDRQIAKIGSFATQKVIRKTDKKFIAVSCHFDIEEWLMPDWVFNTDTMTFRVNEGQKKNRPKLNIEIRTSKSWHETKNVWREFSKHHYLNSEINQNVKAFYLYCNNQLCGFFAYMAFPHPLIKKVKKISRIVILPDYQGIGLHKVLTEICCSHLINSGYRVIGQTSHPAVIKYRKNSINWICKKIGRGGNFSKAHSTLKSIIKTENTGVNSKNQSVNKITTSWEFVLKDG